MTLQSSIPSVRPGGEYPATSVRDELPSAAPGIDLVVLLRILRVRRQVILGTAAIVLAVALLIIFELTPLYSASAIVMLDQQKNNVENVSSVLSGMPTDQASVLDQVQILTSRSLAGRVIDKMRLRDDPDFNGERRGLLAYLNPFAYFNRKTEADIASEAENERNAVIDSFQKNLTVAPIGLSTAIKITFQASGNVKSAAIANAIADAYVEDQLNAKFEATQKATRWLADRIQDLARQSQAADAAVQAYRAANGLTETANGASVVDQQMADINSQLVAARSDLAIKQATYEHVAALQRQGRAADISQAVASPLIAQLRTQESELIRQEADLSSKYGSRNPKMLDLESQKANLGAKIDEEVGRVVQSVANDVDIARAHVNALQESLGVSEMQSSNQNGLKVRLASLQSAASSAKSMYEAFLSKLNQTQDQQGIQTPDARIISRAETPVYASYPNKLLVIGVAVPGGLLLGLMFAFMLERLDSGFRTTYQVESLLDLPVLATVPELKGAESKIANPADKIVDNPMSAYSESVRGLRLGLSLSNVDKQPKIIVVTSSVPNEGKTTLAVSLARMSAQSGQKTLLIDGDMRRPAISNVLGLKAEKDIVDVLVNGTPFEECLVQDPRSSLVVLTCSKGPRNPSDLLASQAMRQLIGNLTKAFDTIIIDSAPVLPVHDTKVLAQLADAVLFVTRWEKTPRDGVVNAIKALRDSRAPLAGVALARADMSRFQYYSYGYQSYRYYDKYYAN